MARSSRLGGPLRLAYADLHNHSHLSDGAGRAEAFFDSMRSAGLDVAALTDHAFVDGEGPPTGLVPAGWRLAGELAEAADTAGAFVALRGFEWSSFVLGHVCVWSSANYHPVGGLPDMAPFWDWLEGVVATEGPEVLAGLNHPGREPGRFANFGYRPQLGPRLVSLELFNKYDDYLFEGVNLGNPSPLVECLDAGWRPGLLGVSDEHGSDWGSYEGKGRAGLWVSRLDRAAVAEALLARRFFATRLSDLRLDARAAGVAMGGVLHHRSGPVTFEVDLDRGSEWVGEAVELQILRPGVGVPAVAHVEPGRFRGAGEPVLRFSVPIDIDDGAWVVLRVADPSTPAKGPGPRGHPARNTALAYASPWYLEP